VFRGGAQSDAVVSDVVVVGFTRAAAAETYWARVGEVALLYFTDPESNPFDRPDSRGLLDAVLNTARACGAEDSSFPAALQNAVAARIAYPGWKLEARVTVEG
jgi:hypothetical protein